MLNLAAGSQAVAMFEHAVQAQIFQLMQLQTYSNQSLTEAFKAVEKAADILGMGNFPLLPNGQHLKKNGRTDLSGHIPTPHVEPLPLTTSQSGDIMDLLASLGGPKCFKCGHFSHIATFCPKKTGLSADTAAQATCKE